MVTFITNTKLLIQTLKHLKAALPNNKSKAFNVTIEITIIDNYVTFAVPGATFSTESKTKGTCKTTISFLHFYQIIKDLKTKEIEIEINNQDMTIGNVIATVNTTFFEDDKILRTIDLPMNYTDADILKLMNEGYTWDEIEFNKLANQFIKANEKMKDNLFKAFINLKIYGVTYEDLEKLTKKRMYNKD